MKMLNVDIYRECLEENERDDTDRLFALRKEVEGGGVLRTIKACVDVSIQSLEVYIKKNK